MTGIESPLLRARLTTRAGQFKRLVSRLRLPETSPDRDAIRPLVRQLHDVTALENAILSEFGGMQRAVADSPAGRAYMYHLATAAVHCTRAAGHLATALQSLTVVPSPGTPSPQDAPLGFTLGHAAARRSLQRSQQALEAGAAEFTEPGRPSLPQPPPAHSRSADQNSLPTRRRPR
ncbi:hypothetical protein [Streptomyces sp. NPDC088141]|uniref:hypothetical protein n=1 Tax=Streptomyces sp. NPDC088141 TaxID=3155179 RepID=UPI003413FCB9